MSTNKKRVLTIITAAVAMLTLISIYLLGSTYAKYLSVESGATASATVADWSVSTAGSYSSEVSFNDLSPSVDDLAENSSVSKSTELKLVAVLSIEADVDATIKFSTTNKEYYIISSDYTETNDYTETKLSSYGSYSKDDVDGLFNLSYRYTTTDLGNAEPTLDNTTAVEDKEDPLDSYTGGTGSKVYYIYASLTWTTTYKDGEKEHALDTWVAKNIDKVKATATVTVTQSSSVPTSSTTESF